MKKSASFFLCLIILLAAGGFAFYLGWSQFKVEPGNVGILVSKTSGTNPVPITHDRFSWNWEFLIPTNASLLTFSPKPYTFEKVVGGVLPSGKEYEKVYGEAVDFSYFPSRSNARRTKSRALSPQRKFQAKPTWKIFSNATLSRHAVPPRTPRLSRWKKEKSLP